MCQEQPEEALSRNMFVERRLQTWTQQEDKQ